ncbi:MAG: geranylgeranylglycerol-phosphate geranylgeranyltransferase [Bacteroidota bacterium]
MARNKAKVFSIKGLLKITRIGNLMIIGLAQYMTAVFLVGPSSEWKQYLLSLPQFLIVISTMLISSAGYIINDYYDQKIDIINRPDKVVVGTNIKRRAAMFYHMLFNFTGVFIGIIANWKIGLVHVVSSFLLWLYSNSLKRLPLIGNLLIGFLTGMAILMMGIYYETLSPLMFAYALFAASIMVVREIIKDMEDMRGEETHGVKSLPLLIGIRKTKHILFVICGVTAVFLVVFLIKVENAYVVYYFLGLIPFVGFFLYQLKNADTVKNFRYLKYLSNLIILSGIISMIFY